MRSLNQYETALLARLAQYGATSTEDGVAVEDVSPDDTAWYHIHLHYPNDTWPSGPYCVVVDWSATDLDGAALELLVLGDVEGRPCEIEIRRLDQQAIRALPTVDMWRWQHDRELERQWDALDVRRRPRGNARVFMDRIAPERVSHLRKKLSNS